MSKSSKTQKCRTCFKNTTKTFPLTKSVTRCTPEITFAQLLQEYAQFDYYTEYESHLPQYLCFLCCSQLKNTYVFIQQAKLCNAKFINGLAKRLCLQEQIIDLPEQQDEASVTIKKDNSDNITDLEYQGTHTSLVANENSSNYGNVFVKNKSFVAEPIIISEQIIEYDSHDSVEMDNESFDTETNDDTFVTYSNEEGDSSNKIEILESVESLQDAEQCPVCNEIIDNHDSLINHIRTYHDVSEAESFKSLHRRKTSSKKQMITCEKCFEIYNNKYEFLQHTKEKHYSIQPAKLENILENQDAVNKVYECQLCDHTARTKSGMRYHLRSKHGTEDDKLKCKFCSYTSLNRSYLLNHVKNVHKELVKTLKANISNKDESITLNTNNRLSGDSSKNYLIITSVDEENSSDNSDNDQDKKDSSDEDFIRNIINMRKKYRTKLSTKALVTRCEECGKIFKNHKTLCNHKRHVHKSEDMFSLCPHCNKKCKRATDLKIHIRQMHGPPEDKQEPKPRSKEKRFMCAECSYTCRTSTILNIHIRLHHTGERPYKCDICSKSFVVSHDLKIHRYLHTGEKPYKCSVCLKCFRDPSNMRKHKILHTNKYPYTCDDCGKGFTQTYHLSVHKRIHLKENKLSCSICGKFFKNNSMLNIHQIKENHFDEVV